jgi:type IV pilus assembly protein PilO
MKNISSQFKNLNINDPGAWPFYPKIALYVFTFIAILIGAYFFDWDNKINEINVAAEKEVTLKSEYVDKKTKSVNLDLYRKRLVEIDIAFGALLRQLPNKSEVDRLVVDINQAGISRGLQFDLFKPDISETKKEFYAELPIKIKVTGDYHKLGAFASDIAQLSRIVTLNDMSIIPGKDGALTLEATAKTFRYLDDDEVSEQKKAASALKSKAAGK